MSNIQRIPLKNKQLIIDFLNANWGNEHPLVNNEVFFNYYYIDGEMTNFYAVFEEDDIIAICGYIKSSSSENSDIWISIWCAKKGKNGAGLALMGSMKELSGAGVISCNNIRENTKVFYEFLGYHPDSLNHHYRLNSDIKSYKIPQLKNISIPKAKKNKAVEIKRFFDVEDISESFNFNIGTTPKKDSEYIKNRYFNNPYYEYMVYGVYFNNALVALFILRLNESEEGFVLRFVDYIGKEEDFILLNGFLDDIIKETNSEYCDIYSFGVNPCKIGFVLREKDDENIIPNYLNPLLSKNIDYHFFTSDKENFMMFKADGDQDRKNIE